MALSFSAVQKAYKVFNKLKIKWMPAWPQDMSEFTEDQKANPETDMIYGWDKKSDDGWEQLFVFIKNPTEEFKTLFAEASRSVPNSSMAEPYKDNPDIWVFGWF